MNQLALLKNLMAQLQAIDERIKKIEQNTNYAQNESIDILLIEKDKLIELRNKILDADVDFNGKLKDYYSQYVCINETIPIPSFSNVVLPIKNYNVNVVFYFDLVSSSIQKYRNGTMLNKAIKEMISIWIDQVNTNNTMVNATTITFKYSIVGFEDSKFDSTPYFTFVNKSTDLINMANIIDNMFSVTYAGDVSTTRSGFLALDRTYGDLYVAGAVNSIFYFTDSPAKDMDIMVSPTSVKYKLTNFWDHPYYRNRIYGVYPTNKYPNLVNESPVFTSGNYKEINTNSYDLRSWAYKVLGE